MNYDKVAEILSAIGNSKEDLIKIDYLGEDFYTEFADVLGLCDYIVSDWAKTTEASEKAIHLVWQVLCDIRDLDNEVMYNSVEEFFRAQLVEES